jgi:hypothetical protein
MDVQTEQPSGQAKTGGMMEWLRLNLGITVMIFSIASGIAGALISGTMRVAATDYQLSDAIRVNNEQEKAIGQFHSDMIDVDKRLNSGVAYTNELRRTRDAEMAALQQRVAVLEAQLRFLADRTPNPPVGPRR